MNIKKGIMVVQDGELKTEDFALEVGCSYLGLLKFLRSRAWELRRRSGRGYVWNVREVKDRIREVEEELSLF